MRRYLSHAVLACALFSLLAYSEQVRVRHTEGLVHGFLVLRTMEGKTLAEGDLTEVADGDTVTNHLVFRFKDGSVHDETAVFSQRDNFRLLKDHLVQKGPAFRHAVDLSIDTAKGEVTVHYDDDDGEKKITTDRLDLPVDVANGLVLTLLKNIHPDVPQTKVSMVAVTPKPRIVKLAITPAGEETFSTVHSSRKAIRYAVNVEIGGITGWFAHLLGKVPPTTHVWILRSEVPAFVKSEGPLYMGGPVWRIELATPVWPKTATADVKNQGEE
jgi:hypothetical protein